MLIRITRDGKIPMYGFDFIGIIDRGTNIIEIKPTTLCNMKCAYCYANVGSYSNDFEVERDFLVEGLKKVVEIKKENDLEVHVDPYGEILLYKDLPRLISDLKSMREIKKLSIQSNGTLLTEKKIVELKNAGLDQVNISLNALDEALLKKLSRNENYNLKTILSAVNTSLDQGMHVVLSPVWFFGVNDDEIEKIITLYKELKENLADDALLSIGIQNYLVYKTGRKLKKTKQREFNYFYKRLRQLEKKYGVKLLLGPSDFNIHSCSKIEAPIVPFIKESSRSTKKTRIIEVEIVSAGRYSNEFLGKVDGWGVKVINFSRRPLKKVEQVPANAFKIKQGNLLTCYVKV
ncbi:MAG: radical SAM protein [Promethearchaeota archaeon]